MAMWKRIAIFIEEIHENRIFVGIVVICGVHKLGVLNFNLMIPIEDEQLQLIDLTIHKRDRENIKHYKELCKQELEWCQEHNELICNKADVLYKKYISDETFSGKERCLNFSRLEAECEKFNSKIRS